ncbi:MAG: hypothetical protein R6W77_14205, partial [Trueperaceae bacterium]
MWLGRAATGGGTDPALTLAAFHTLFNLVGVALVLPWLGGFARMVSRLVPDQGAALTRPLTVTHRYRVLATLIPDTSATDGFSPTERICSPRLVRLSTNQMMPAKSSPMKKNGDNPKMVGIRSMPSGPVN